MHRLLSGAAFLLAVLAAASALAQPRPRPNVVVRGEEITLGDIFDGAGALADIHLAAAPAPGQTLVLRRAQIEALAEKHGLDWRSPAIPIRVEVVRASRAVPKSAVLEALTEALGKAGAEGRFRVELRTTKPALLVADDAAPTVAVESLDLDRRSRRFTATLAAPAGKARATRVQVSGRIVPMTEIPVLRHRVAVGAIVSEEDITWLTVRTDKVNPGIVTEMDDLLGKSPRRSFRPRRPIRARDVQRPVMVEKGGLVTMILSTSAMVITASGRALEAGGEGEVVRVRNTRTHLVVQGIIAGPTKVRVPPRPRLVGVSN